MDVKEHILIVDDSEMNRALLAEMLGEEFDILEAENGSEAVAIIREKSEEIALVLLDMIMPVMNGLEVLEIMSKNGWLTDIPVIMISSEESERHVHKAYELDVTDYIRRPFDVVVVTRRCKNIIALYAKQKKLVGIVADQFYENEKNSRVMINILAHIVEFRNGESGMHVINVQSYTEILLKQLRKTTDKYPMTEKDIMQIVNISALHDIGKITIPDEILNKPGRLTDEEFKIMKSHSAAGSQMLADMSPMFKDEPIIKTAYEISRWHHERWDGRGYPDGLKGDEIPISAQVVSLADVYDALTSERVYKRAFSHETAVEMIIKGECGAFNPVLLECLKGCEREMAAVKEKGSGTVRGESEIKDFAKELLRSDALYSSDRLLVMLEYERMKNRFFEGITGGCSFEYNIAADVLSLSKRAAELIGCAETLVDPVHDETLNRVFCPNAVAEISSKLRAAFPENPIVQFYVSWTETNGVNSTVRVSGTLEEAEKMPQGAQKHVFKLLCMTTWTIEEPRRYTGTIGKLVPVMDDYGFMKGVDSIDIERLL